MRKLWKFLPSHDHFILLLSKKYNYTYTTTATVYWRDKSERTQKLFIHFRHAIFLGFAWKLYVVVKHYLD